MTGVARLRVVAAQGLVAASVLGGAAALAGAFREPGQEPAKAPGAEPITGEAPSRPGQMLTARSEIEGETTVIMLLPEGTRVREKQLVCEMDTTPAHARLNGHQILETERAKRIYEAAREAHEIAELELDIYERVTYPGEVAAVYGEIELAGEALELEQARLARVQEGADLEKMERGLAVKKADLALQEAIRKKDRLEKGTQQVQLKRLGADVQDTRAAMLLADREFRLEKEREERLHAMIEKGKVYAPADGVVVHARLGPEQGGTKVGEGTTIREGQQIFHITMEPERSESEVK